MSDYWFAAAPSKQQRSRISLNFGLARADRLLRERVVPELGRVWFVRQLSWPAAALALRDDLKGVVNVKASAISHGLEALGCKLEWDKNRDGARILGKRAFGRDGDDDIWGFDKLRVTKHYVQNTHRQAASRTLRDDGGLGLASGSRFDVFELTTTGKQLADALLDQLVGKGGGRLRGPLGSWICLQDIDRSRTLRHALAPSYSSEPERQLVRARVFGTASVGCTRRVHAAAALGLAREPRNMPEVATRLRDDGHIEHANDVVAAHAFGIMIDRARDLAAVISQRVEEARRGWALGATSGDNEIRNAVSALKNAGDSFRKKSESAKFQEPKSGAFARSLDENIQDVVASVARSTAEVFSVADDRVMRGPLFRVVEGSEAMREAIRKEETEEGADALEPDSTNQTFRLANLHALARDLEGKVK